MPTIRFTKENWPASAPEFMRTLQEAWQNSLLVNDFVELVRELTLLEQKHGLDSIEFYKRYQQSEMGDEMEIMRWATKVEIYGEVKKYLELIPSSIKGSMLVNSEKSRKRGKELCASL